jgi:O-antigen/teichoic acid export membrane protein
MSERIEHGRKRLIATHAWVSLSFTVLTMLMAPIRIRILTHSLSKADYGILSLLILTANSLGFIALLGQRQYLIYSLPGKSHEERGTYVNSTLLSTLIGGLLGGIIFYFAGKYIPFLAENFSTALVWIGAIFIASYAVTSLGMGYLLAIGDVIRYRALIFSASSLWLVAAIPILLFRSLSLTSIAAIWLGGLLVSGLLCALVVTRNLGKALRMPPKGSLMRLGIAYGVPIIPRNFANFLMRLADRYVILYLINTAAVALYTVPATLVMFAADTQYFLEFMFPHISEQWKKNREEGKPGCTGQSSTLFHIALRLSMLMTVPMAVGVVLWGPTLVNILAGKAYSEANIVFRYMAPLIVAIPFTHFVHFALMLDGRTRIIGGLIIASSVANVVLNIFLIPIMGIQGAALATTISYFLLLVVSMTWSRLMPYFHWALLKPVPLIICTALMLGAALLTRHLVGCATFWETIPAGIVFIGAGFATRLCSRDELQVVMRRKKKKPTPATAEDPDE